MIPLPSFEILNQYSPFQKVVRCQKLFARQADDVFALWYAWEEATGVEQDVPFWATVWPGAVMFARYIFNDQIAITGKKVLDLGCGGAVAGIAAAKGGASEVIANDVDPVALEIAAQNAAANKVSILLDNSDYLNASALPESDVILVADMFYHKEQARRLMSLLTEAAQKGSQVFIADGQRAFAPKNNVRLIAAESIPVNFDLEGVKERKVRLLALEKIF